MAVHEQALLAPDRDDKPRPTPESSRGSTTEAAEQRVERPSVSSDLGPDCEEILAGRPFYLRAVSVECQQSLLMHGHCSGLSSLSSASKACSCTADAVACRLCRVPMTHPGEQQGLHHRGRAASREAVRELRSRTKS